MASDDWEQHKARIVLMYCVEKQPLRHIISYMREHHNFNKKSCQYEYRLRTWGIKKNATKDNWNYVAYRIRKRDQKGKSSKVVLYGVPVPEERLRKEVQRYTNIPTAVEFGMRGKHTPPLLVTICSSFRSVPSPQTPDSGVVCIRSPSIMELDSIWPETLPWLQFEQKLRPVLHQPFSLLHSLLTAFGSIKLEPRYQKSECLLSLFPISGDISMLHKAISRYSNMIPSNCQEMKQSKALTPAHESYSIAMDMLKIIFFQMVHSILNKKDQFVLRLVEALSRSHPQMKLLSRNSYTNPQFDRRVIQLFCAFWRPASTPDKLSDYPIIFSLRCRLRRDKITMSFFHHGSLRLRCTGIQFAAITADTRLGKMLLDAGANPNTSNPEYPPPLQLIGLHSNTNPDDTLEFAHMLIKYGAIINPPPLYRHGTVINSSPLDLALARHDKLLADFLIDQGANKTLCSFWASRFEGGWYSLQLKPRGFRYSPLLVAIVSGINEITEQLLQPILSRPDEAPPNFIRDIFITSCLAGNAAVVSRLLLSLDIDLDNNWAGGITPLVATAWNIDVTIAEMLLTAGADVGPKVNTWDTATRTLTPAPLHVAAFHGNAELVQILIGRGASCNVQLDYRGDSDRNSRDDSEPWPLPFGLSNPLHLALMSEDLATVTLILPHSELVGGEIAQAVNFGDKTIISKLINKGADILFVTQDGTTALDIAAEEGNTEIISLFFDSGGKYRSSALYRATTIAIRSGDHSLLMNLMDYRPAGPIDSYEASCLVLALQESELDLVRQLLNSLASGPSQSFYLLESDGGVQHELVTSPTPHEYPDHCGTGITPLWAAYLSGDVSIIKEMLRLGYNLQKGDQESFSRSILYFNDERSNSILHLVLSTSQFEGLNQAGRQMLLLGSIKLYDQQKTQAQEYIKLIDSLNFTCGDAMVYSPLILAVKMNRSDLVSELIDAGADVNYIETENTDVYQYTVLEHAAVLGHVDVMELLMDRGANINKRPSCYQEDTPLQIAARWGYLKMVKVLIDNGADINALPAKYLGRTALEEAAENGRLDVVQYLLAKGASLNGEMRIYYVRSVREAMRRGHYVIAKYLKEYGSWTEKDQILYDHPIISNAKGYFRYDDQSNNWHFRQVEWDDDAGWYSMASTSTISSSEDGTCDGSSEEEEDISDSDHGELAAWREPEREMEDWFRSLADTFDESADFGAIQEEAASNHLTLPFRTSNLPELDSCQILSSGGGENSMVRLAEPVREQQLHGQLENVDSQPIAGEEPMPELVDEQVLTTDTELMSRNDPFFGADEIEDVWDI
ncbi:hypothetical protein RRF57_007443 [Xylaria bambusicola]|uniref:Clr5 domain-containing protein n=1 Tax=Xylaria bambusicola TaxID=326684 RepID=A0AAN7V0M9_9PEZI